MSASTPAEEEQVTEGDRDLARLALAERMRRKFPDRSPPRWYPNDEVELVAERAFTIGGTSESKQRALHDALEGAFSTSRKGAPSVAFVWGTLEHFLDHVERGKRRRIRADLAAHAPKRHAGADPEEQRKAREYGLALVQAQLDVWSGKSNREPNGRVPADLGTHVTNNARRNS